MCPGVPTTCTSSPSTATTSPSPRPSSPSRCCGSSARTPQPTRSANDRARLGVVEVAVGEQHDGHVAGVRRDRVEVRVDLGPRVDDHGARGARLAEHPGVGAVERHHVRVRREHAAGPLAERPAGPGLGHRRSRAATSSPSADQPVGDGEVGALVVDARPAARPTSGRGPPAAASTSAGCARSYISRQRAVRRRQHQHLVRRRPPGSPRAAAATPPGRTRSTRRG